MTQQKIKKLKEKIELHYDILEEKYPMTKIVIDSINAFLELNVSDKIIRSWYDQHIFFIRDIEKEINKIESELRTIK